MSPPNGWVRNRSAPVRGRSGLGGGSSTRHLDPRTTSGDQTVRPGRRDRRRRPLLTRRDLPRKWGPSDPLPILPALPSGPSSCPVRAPEDPVGTSPQRSAQPPLPHTLVPSRLRRTPPSPAFPGHGHQSGSLPAWASLRVPMPHPHPLSLCPSLHPSIRTVTSTPRPPRCSSEGQGMERSEASSPGRERR